MALAFPGSNRLRTGRARIDFAPSQQRSTRISGAPTTLHASSRTQIRARAQVRGTDGTARQQMGAAVAQLFSVSDWPSLQQRITPPAEAALACHDAATAVSKCLEVGKAQLVGSVPADLHLPGCDADIVVLVPDFRVENHSAALAAVTSALRSSAGQQEGFVSVQAGEFSVQCIRKGLSLDILVGSADPIAPLAFLDPGLTTKQRQALSASTAVATTAFLQQQPALFKTAVRLVKYWAKDVHGDEWSDQLRNRCVNMCASW